jgi:hypothetical protein
MTLGEKLRREPRSERSIHRLVRIWAPYLVCAVYVAVGHGVYVVVGHRLGRGAELLSGLGPVDVEMTECVTAGAVDGDVGAVEEHRDLGAGVGSADGDHGWAGESDVAVGEDGENFDLGVALDGELAGPAVGGCVVPCLLWAGASSHACCGGLFQALCRRRVLYQVW